MTDSNWLMVSYEPAKESALFEWALQQCKKQNYHLDLLVVLPDLSFEVFKWFEMHNQQDIQQQQIERETKKRQDWMQRANEHGVSCSLNIRFGKLFYEAIVFGMQRQADWLIKLADDIEDQQGFLFKSDDWHLLRKSPLPILLYRHNTPLPFTKVMASIDVDIETDPYEPTELNQSLLARAQQLQPDNALHIVHAWQAQIEKLARHWSNDLSSQQLNELSEHLYFHHKKALNIELEKFDADPSEARLYLCEGEPVEAIAATVEKQNVDLLVLGTLARAGIPGLLIGNTAEDLLERVNCSVLAIKPKTFKTPINPEG